LRVGTIVLTVEKFTILSDIREHQMPFEGPDIRHLAYQFMLLLSFWCSSENAWTEEIVPLCVGESPPYMGKNFAGGGPSVEVIRQAFQGIGVDVSTIYAPWSRLLRMGVNGDCLIVGIWRGPDRDRFFNYSTLPLSKQRLSLYKKRNRVIDKNNTNLVLGIERGTYITPIVEQLGWRISKNTSQVQNLRLLKAGRVDLVFGEQGALDYLISRSDDFKGEFELFQFTVEIKGAYLATSLTNSRFDALMVHFNEEFASMLSDGRYEKIIAGAKALPHLKH